MVVFCYIEKRALDYYNTYQEVNSNFEADLKRVG